MGLFSRKSTNNDNNDNNDSNYKYASLSAYDPIVEAAKELDAASEATRRGDSAAGDRHTAKAQEHLDAAKRCY